MKLILLNVDGVLVHDASLAAAGNIPLGRDYFARIIDPACVLRLARIVQFTGASAVVTSPWRRVEEQRAGLVVALRRGGLRYSDMLVMPSDIAAENRDAYIHGLLAGGEDGRAVALDDCPAPAATALDPRPSFFNGGLLDIHVDQAIQVLGLR